MKSIRPLALLFGLLLAGRALAVHLPVVLTEHVDDETLSLSIDEEALSRGPVWRPGQGPVPLTVADAVARLTDWARKAHPGFRRIVIEEIVLKPIESPRYGTHWHYLVVYRGLTDGQGSGGKPHVAAVLFDGTVVPGVVEPRP